MSAREHDFNGWDIVERYYREFDRFPDLDVVELHADIVSTALLVEMERPPWWRDIDRDRKELTRELAG